MGQEDEGKAPGGYGCSTLWPRCWGRSLRGCSLQPAWREGPPNTGLQRAHLREQALGVVAGGPESGFLDTGASPSPSFC